MSQVQHYQTVAQEEEIEDLLTVKQLKLWLSKNYFPTDGELYFDIVNNSNAIALYLKEHGLPLDSKIKGL